MNRPILALAILVSGAVVVSSAGAIFEFARVIPDAAASNLPAQIPLFQFERQAQLHCPDDSIVWATAGTGAYRTSADRWYGRASNGAFGCLHEAQQAGYRGLPVER